MKFNNEKETKELSFGGAESATPVSAPETNETTPTPEVNEPKVEETPTPKVEEVKIEQPKPQAQTMIIGDAAPKPASINEQKPASGNGGSNSFYERQQDNQADTKWTKDWRGKTLGLTLAALILIGAGIPAGMAMAGYWHDPGSANLVDKTEVETAVDFASDEVQRIYDLAVLDHYDSLVYEGYITEDSHDDKIENAEDSAWDTIDNEKETLKANYGDTWEEEWDNSLKEKGFHTKANGGEDEYVDSMVASAVEETIKSQYNTKNALTSPVSETDLTPSDYDFISTEANSKGKYYYIENMVPVFYSDDGASSWDDIETSYSYTPEDLMNLFVWTYEPIVFNNSLLPFTPVEGANDTEADIQGDNVYMSNDNVKSAWSFARAEDAGTAPAATNYGGIQKKYNVDLSSQGLGVESVIAIDEIIYGRFTTGKTTITDIVNAAFAATGLGTVDVVTSTDISNMNTNDVQTFSEEISSQLKTEGLLTPDGGTRNFATTNIFTPTSVSNKTVSFVSTNGLNNIGVSFEDEEVIVEQLDNYAGANGAIDLALVSTFNTWFAEAFEYITIIDFLTNPTDTSQGWFNGGTLDLTWDTNNLALVGQTIDEEDIETIAGEGATEADAQYAIQTLFPYVLFGSVALDTMNSTTETYNSVKTFVDTNWKDYESENFSTGLGMDILKYINSSNLNKFSLDYFGNIKLLADSKTSTKNEVINKGGDE